LFAIGVGFTGGKFAAGVVDTCGPLDLQISPQIFEKIWNGPNLILWGWGETDSWKKTEAKKISWHCPFKGLGWPLKYEKVQYLGNLDNSTIVPSTDIDDNLFSINKEIVQV
jgi:hypothetical protein